MQFIWEKDWEQIEENHMIYKRRFKEEDDRDVEREYLKHWSRKLMDLLKVHKISGFHNDVRAQNITDKKSTKDTAVINAEIIIDELIIELSFYHQNDFNYETKLFLTSPQKRGDFMKKVTGKNATPEGSIKLLDDMFKLKYKR